MKYIGWIILGVILFLGVSACSVVAGTYNGFVTKNQGVERAAAQVQIDLQRQYNLIPELIHNAQASGRFERGTLDDITRNRAAAGGVINLNPADIANSPRLQQQLFEAQQGLSASLGRLMVVMERYPDLQTTQLYRGLQDEMAGSQNRIAYSRAQWTQATSDYNNAVQQFPGNLFAGMFGFHTRAFYTAQSNVTEVPELPYDETQQPAQHP